MKPNVGMLYPVCAPIATYTPGTGVTYSTGCVVAEARSATLNWTRADGEFYGDDALLDTDNGIRGYELDFEPTGLSDSVRHTLLGEDVANTSEYYITDATTPDVGFGYVRVMRTDGTSGVKDSYEAWWFYKLKFGMNSEETRTKERNREWRTPTLNGVGAGVQLESGGKLKFATRKTFATKADAISYVKSKAGIS